MNETAQVTERPSSATGGTPGSTAASTAPAEGIAGPAPAAADAAIEEPAATGGVVSEGGTPADAAPDTEVLVVPGIARFHQADCILIRFLGEDDLQKMSRQEAEAAGCAACRACRP